MSEGQRLRALVNERLTAAAEDIFALFERTIAEYEEELCRSKEENERKQQLLDSVLSPRVLQVHGAGVQIHAVTKEIGPTLEQESTLSVDVKDDPEEECYKQEEEQLPEFTAVSVKSEEQSSLLQQRQTEHREETQAYCREEPVSRCGHLELETDEQTDNSSDPDIYEEPPASSSAPQMETEADDYNQVNDVDLSLLEHSNINILISGISVSDDREKTQECSICKQLFPHKHNLRRHLNVHTGEKPFSCPVCMVGFQQKVRFRKHMSTHATKKGFSCSICNESFTQKDNLKTHKETHVGERPFSCTECNARFIRRANLNRHLRVHVVK